MGKYRIITIAREYASGGSEIGRLVGQLLGLPVYGREILEMAARRGGTTPENIQHLEETGTNSLLYSLVSMGNAVYGRPAEISHNDALNLLEARIIEELAKRPEGCVIVGRCAGWVLRERKDVLTVFVGADEDFRLRRAAEIYGIPQDRAKATLHAFDRRRAAFYHANTGLTWKEKTGYHMVLDSSRMGIEPCARLIAFAAGKEE